MMTRSKCPALNCSSAASPPSASAISHTNSLRQVLTINRLERESSTIKIFTVVLFFPCVPSSSVRGPCAPVAGQQKLEDSVAVSALDRAVKARSFPHLRYVFAFQRRLTRGRLRVPFENHNAQG